MFQEPYASRIPALFDGTMRYNLSYLNENYDKTSLKKFKKHKWAVNKHFYLGIDKKMKWMSLIDSI